MRRRQFVELQVEAALLGVALVYLGEHYVVDLVAGAALAEGVRTQALRAAPAARQVRRMLNSLNRLAAGG